ncbi:hypothetical protein GLOIN_2v1782088 [Rhizophagus irregularis DAOM 181602=DAOM 197198]|nr:hypothetical protein GLOIN_2v1782088 [Rhizophagus irregularis DAOM 181602=DAOM 197198]
MKKLARNPQKLCYNCEETIDCVKLVSNKVNKIEEIVNNFKNIKKKPEKLSKFNAKFTLNNVPCELEYDLSSFTLENLQKLVAITTQFTILILPQIILPRAILPQAILPQAMMFLNHLTENKYETFIILIFTN